MENKVRLWNKNHVWRDGSRICLLKRLQLIFFENLYCSPTVDKESYRLRLRDKNELLIGNYGKAPICFNFPLVSREHAKLIYNNGVWVVQDLNSKYGTYVNGIAITSRQLQYGDIIFIMGLKIILMGNSIYMNNPQGNVNYYEQYFELIAGLLSLV